MAVGMTRQEYWTDRYNHALEVLGTLHPLTPRMCHRDARKYADIKTDAMFGKSKWL